MSLERKTRAAKPLPSFPTKRPRMYGSNRMAPGKEGCTPSLECRRSSLHLLRREPPCQPSLAATRRRAMGGEGDWAELAALAGSSSFSSGNLFLLAEGGVTGSHLCLVAPFCK